jgi:hypothetical protein
MKHTQILNVPQYPYPGSRFFTRAGVQTWYRQDPGNWILLRDAVGCPAGNIVDKLF